MPAVIVADRAGLIVEWNAAAEALFGFSAAEVVGGSLDVIIPEHLRAAHWAGYRRAIEAGRTAHESVPRKTRALHKDGRKLYVDMSFGVVTGANGTVSGAKAVARLHAPSGA